jgi:enamine deaminase RidA (YjgF/YER057c/UK114 family)
MKAISALPLAIALAGCAAPVQYVNPPELPRPPIFSQAVVTPAQGKLVFISGQVAFDRDAKIVGEGDMGRQMEQSFANLKRAIDAAGAKPEHVTRLMVFIVDYRPEHLKLLFPVIRAHFPADKLPANTLLGVSRLARDGLLFEVQADAVVPD